MRNKRRSSNNWPNTTRTRITTSSNSRGSLCIQGDHRWDTTGRYPRKISAGSSSTTPEWMCSHIPAWSPNVMGVTSRVTNGEVWAPAPTPMCCCMRRNSSPISYWERTKLKGSSPLTRSTHSTANNSTKRSGSTTIASCSRITCSRIPFARSSFTSWYRCSRSLHLRARSRLLLKPSTRCAIIQGRRASLLRLLCQTWTRLITASLTSTFSPIRDEHSTCSSTITSAWGSSRPPLSRRCWCKVSGKERMIKRTRLRSSLMSTWGCCTTTSPSTGSESKATSSYSKDWWLTQFPCHNCISSWLTSTWSHTSLTSSWRRHHHFRFTPRNIPSAPSPILHISGMPFRWYSFWSNEYIYFISIELRIYWRELRNTNNTTTWTLPPLWQWRAVFEHHKLFLKDVTGTSKLRNPRSNHPTLVNKESQVLISHRKGHAYNSEWNNWCKRWDDWHLRMYI